MGKEGEGWRNERLVRAGRGLCDRGSGNDRRVKTMGRAEGREREVYVIRGLGMVAKERGKVTVS
jgi:hypothetical protein